MNRLEINLASDPFKSNVMYYAFHGLLIALFVLATSLNLYFYLHFRALRGEMKTMLSNSQQEMTDLDRTALKIRNTIAKKNIKDISTKCLFSNEIILMRKFFWTELFNKLEEVTPYSIKMQSIRPIFTESGIEVSVDGLAQNLQSFFEFEKNLQSNPNFSNIRPESYRQLQNTEFSFSLVFGYRQTGSDIDQIYNEKATFSHIDARTGRQAPAPQQAEDSAIQEQGKGATETQPAKGE